jgi:hypothetical protein
MVTSPQAAIDLVVEKFMSDLTILTHAFISADGRKIGNHVVKGSFSDFITVHRNGFFIAQNKCTKEIHRFLLKNLLMNICEKSQDEN